MGGNDVNIKGRISRDVDCHQVENGSYVINFTICWQQRKKQNEEFVSVPHFFDCKMWLSEKQSQIILPKLVKGAEVALVNAHLELQKWETETGENRSKVILYVDDPIGGLLICPKAEKGDGEFKEIDIA